MTGVWESAAANMRTYLMLKERAAAFRRIPRSKQQWRLPGGVSWRNRRLPRTRPIGTFPPWQMLTQTSWRSVDTGTCDSTSWRSNTSSAPANYGPCCWVDSSTQSCKVVIRELETGTIVRSGRASHPDGTEADPEAWWNALQLAVRDAGGLDDVSAVGIGGQQHGMVCLDVAGNVVRPALLWNDTRSAAAASDLVSGLELRRGRRQWEAFLLLRSPSANFVGSPGMSRRQWPRPQPSARPRLANVKLVGGGLQALVTDRGDASGTGYWSPATDEYRLDLLSWRPTAVTCSCRLCLPLTRWRGAHSGIGSDTSWSGRISRNR